MRVTEVHMVAGDGEHPTLHLALNDTAVQNVLMMTEKATFVNRLPAVMTLTTDSG